MTNNLSNLYTIEQNRAQKAFNFIEEITDKDMKEYKSAVDRFPAMIINCGLLQAVSFYKSKSSLKVAFNALKGWFCEYYQWDNNICDIDFIKKIIDLDISEYREKTRESLAFLVWLKRFSEIRYNEI